MKYYDDCFSGSDALAWIHDFLKLNPNFGQNVSRTQAKLLCQKLLQRNVFEDVVGQFKSTKSVFEENHLYSFVGKAGFTKQARVAWATDGKENANSTSVKAQASSNKAGTTLKRHSSFSDRLQLTRKPLGSRKGLQNISNEPVNHKNTPKKPTRSSLRQNVNNQSCTQSNEKAGLQNIGTVNIKPVQSKARPRGKHSRKGMSGLTRKWKSEYDISLMGKKEQNCDEDMKCVEDIEFHSNKRTDKQVKSDEHTQTVSNGQVDCHSMPNHNTNVDICQSESQGTSSENPEGSVGNHEEECCLQTDPNELWMTVCLKR